MKFFASAWERRLLAFVVLLVLAVVAFLAGRYLQSRGLVWAVNFSNIASMVLAVVALLMPLFSSIVGWVSGPALVTSDQVSGAAEDLAAGLAWCAFWKTRISAVR